MNPAVLRAPEVTHDDSAHSYELRAPATLTTPCVARHFVTGVLAASGHSALADDARICVSDAVTNAVQHAGVQTLRIELTANTNGIVVAVCDDNVRRLPWPRQARDDEESGRGLTLVRGIAHSSGVSWIWDELQLVGKRVWFELRDGQEEGATRPGTARGWGGR
ncbi:ATP-binding protein [Streptomyces orinoci]|uniref:ATP-binding protein n=1 Tax=Streptomyces orinoci TaxID=67339 RepID=A0ABV3JSR3_STRON|nr:ATP-binding protein [Streptomyces orinoci]